MSNEILLKNIPEEALNSVTNIEWYGHNLQIKKNIHMVDMMEFVANVVQSCFDRDGGYIPEVYDFMIKYNIVTRYANLKLPHDVTEQYELLYTTDLCNTVLMYANDGQVKEIVRSIDRKLKYITDAHTMQANVEIQKIANVFSELRDRLNTAVDTLAGVDIKDALEKFSNLDEKAVVRAYAEGLKADGSKPNNGENE